MRESRGAGLAGFSPPRPDLPKNRSQAAPPSTRSFENTTVTEALMV